MAWFEYEYITGQQLIHDILLSTMQLIPGMGSETTVSVSALDESTSCVDSAVSVDDDWFTADNDPSALLFV